MLDNFIPGTNIPYKENEEAFQVLKPMIEITGGISLSQICSITGLNTSTIQNWVKRSYVPHPVNKKYHERHLARILLISALKDCMNIEDIGELMILINGDTDDESDDIISETKLYDYLCLAIARLKLSELDETHIEKVLNSILSKDVIEHEDRLMIALKAMIYSYVSGKYMKMVNINMQLLKND